MKVKPGTPPAPVHEVVNNWMLSTLPSGSTIAKTNVTNYMSASSAYQQMNALIIRLDQHYNGLTPTQQAAWTSLVPNFAGKEVCGCPRASIDGQKLARLVGYNAGGPTTVPPAFSGDLSGGFGIFSIVTPPTPAHPYLYVFGSPNPSGTRGTVQLGQGLGNPSFNITVAQPYEVVPDTDQRYSQMAALPALSTFNVCLWSGEGYPCGVEQQEIQHI